MLLDNDDDADDEYVNFQVIDEFNEKFGPAVSFTLNAFLLKPSALMIMGSYISFCLSVCLSLSALSILLCLSVCVSLSASLCLSLVGDAH